ncbi:hypothetical protein GOB05_27330 [Sinorhizobium meliloti]|nr:hypothetical protein [Sinorhizobium meliloti]
MPNRSGDPSTEYTLFIFGAGASHFSPGILPRSPPLGPQLFRHLFDFDNFFTKLPPEVLDLFGNQQFEKAVEVLDVRYPELMGRFQSLMAKYFVQFFPDKGRATLYHALFRQLIAANARFGIASLNYELVAETALQEECEAIGLKSMALQEIFKPHGSCNFILNFGNNSYRNVSAVNTNPNGGDFLAPVRVLDRISAMRTLSDPENKIAPAISNYGKGKRTRNSSPFIEGHRVQLRTSIEKAKHVIIIGVFCDPDSDPHIWDPLRERRRGVWVVNPDMRKYSEVIPASAQLFKTFDVMVAPESQTILSGVLCI